MNKVLYPVFDFCVQGAPGDTTNVLHSTIKKYVWCVLLGVMMASGLACTNLSLDEDPDRYQDQIVRLEARIELNPTDTDALRELGIIYMRTRQFEKAGPYLERRLELSAEDPEIMMFYGLYLEQVGRRTEALDVYEGYIRLPERSRFRRLMAGRYQVLSRDVFREELRTRIADEAAFSEIPPNTIAVFPLTYRGDDPRFGPLGRGLSSMMTLDLARVDQLTVLERARLEVLLEELKLAESPYADPETAPRTGRLLGAERLIGGSYTVLEGEQFHLDLAMNEVQGGALTTLDPASDLLTNLFVVQKDLVFNLVEEMGITLTPEERLAIETIPTQNLQAFLAYARGLEEEDAGRFDAAANLFQEAVQLDPGFEAASNELADAEAVNASGTTADQVMAEAVESSETETGTTDQVRDLQVNLHQAQGGLFLPGEDSRKPAAEANASAEILRDPPPPPPRGN